MEANEPMSTIEYLWRVSQQLIVAKDNGMQYISGFGSGFFLNYANRLFFVTADHVLQCNNYKVKARIFKEDYLFIANNVMTNDGVASAYTPLGGFYYFDKYNFASILDENHADIDGNAKPDMQDYAFCLRKNEFQCPFLTHALIDDNQQVVVPEKKEKLIISHEIITEPRKEDYYIIAGVVMVQIVDNQINRCNAVHQDLKYERMQDDLIVLKYPEKVIYEHWAGLSGSPVLNQKGKLLGMAIRVNCKKNEVIVVPMKKILQAMQYALKYEDSVGVS